MKFWKRSMEKKARLWYRHSYFFSALSFLIFYLTVCDSFLFFWSHNINLCLNVIYFSVNSALTYNSWLLSLLAKCFFLFLANTFSRPWLAHFLLYIKIIFRLKIYLFKWPTFRMYFYIFVVLIYFPVN